MFRSGSLWIIIGCLYFTGSLHAQEEANVIKIEALEHDRQSSTRQFLKYRLQAADEDIYTVKVVNGKGEIESMPVRSEHLTANAQYDFVLRTQYWKPGTYQIIATARHGKTYVRSVEIHRRESRND